ncbi:putative lipoprotein [Aminobacter lissarensis]|uniref:Lipoprotein n=1 Tax=Aminobacter carboxidus TaxID=376165 RepID=A0A8E1WDB8_9HYPH|nr:YbaY family lipoprotein [Aminobacter lissarensis]MBB6466158.1 putative lipoprotein [Aminobacter lissarensis]
MLGKLAEFLMFGMAPLLVGMMAVPTLATADETLVTGEVLYRERIALPANAVLEVQLADVSLADAPAKILGAQKIDPAGQVPIRFAIPFDPTAIKTNMTYALQARISVDDQLWFINDVSHTLDPLTAGPQTIQVKMVRQSAATEEVTIFDRDWVAEEIDGAAAHDKAKPTLRIGTDGKVSGRGGCNGFFGSAKVDGDKVAFGQMGSTEMACEQAVMEQEHRFHQALERATSFRIVEGKLLVADKDGKDILRFTAAS